MGLQEQSSMHKGCPKKEWIHKDFLKTALMMVLEDSQQWKRGFQSRDMRWHDVYSVNLVDWEWAISELSSIPWKALWRAKVWWKNDPISLKSKISYKIFICESTF